MHTLSLQTQSRTLTAVGVVGFALALAAASQVAIPLPGTPVPLTLQPMLVVIAGLVLGPRAAAASMALYLGAGALGAPVFTPIGAPGALRLVGPTGGYLLAYPAAAALAGMIGHGQGFARRLGGALAGMATLYAGGLAQLALLTGSLEMAAVLGAVPFMAADAVKSVVAALVSRRPAASREA